MNNLINFIYDLKNIVRKKQHNEQSTQSFLLNNIEKYFIKYLSKPKPIILENITSDSLSIDNETEKMGCSLNTALHRPILERAVALAIKRLPSK